MSSAHRHLSVLVDFIENDEVRAEQQAAVDAWAENLPKRGVSLATCVGCHTESYIRKGAMCGDCMEAIILTQITRHKTAPNLTPVAVPDAPHHMEFGYVTRSDQTFDPGERFNRHFASDRPESIGGAWRKLLHKLSLSVAATAEKVPMGSPAKGLLNSSSYDSLTRFYVHADFPDALMDVAEFGVLIGELCYAKGVSDGSDMLVSLAAGTMTHEAFTERQVRAMEHSEEKLRQALKKG